MANKKIYPNLDGLRAYAAFGIVIMHVYANMEYQYQGLVDNIICSFAELTLLFFILSAFSLCCGYYEQFRNGKIDVIGFYKRRFSRIWPFFAMMTVIDILVSPSWNSLWEGISNVSMVFGLLPNPDIDVIGVGWFVGVIFVFYLLFPFFVYMIETKRKVIIVFLCSIIVFMVTCNYWMTTDYILTPIGKHNFLYSSPFFIVGGGIYVYRDEISQFVTKYFTQSFMIVTFISCLYFIIPRVIDIGETYKIGFIDTTYEFVGKEVLNFSVLYMLPILASWICLAIGPTKLLWTNKLTRFISAISMEIYLSHMMAFRLVERLNISNIVFNDEVAFWISAILTLLIAVIFSYTIKCKMIPLLSNYIKKNT